MVDRPEEEAEQVEAGRRGRRVRLQAKRHWTDLDFGQLAVLHWYALVVKPGFEGAVEAQLERKGLVAVVPVRREWRSVGWHAERKKPYEIPLAPRYVLIGFAGAPAPEDWHGVRVITMVSGVVSYEIGAGYDDVPLRMSGVQVALFLFRNWYREVPKEWSGVRTHGVIEKGDLVDVIDGPHAGSKVRVKGLRGDVASVLLPLFGRIDVPLAKLAKSV